MPPGWKMSPPPEIMMMVIGDGGGDGGDDEDEYDDIGWKGRPHFALGQPEAAHKPAKGVDYGEYDDDCGDENDDDDFEDGFMMTMMMTMMTFVIMTTEPTVQWLLAQ